MWHDGLVGLMVDPVQFCVHLLIVYVLMCVGSERGDCFLCFLHTDLSTQCRMVCNMSNSLWNWIFNWNSVRVKLSLWGKPLRGSSLSTRAPFISVYKRAEERISQELNSERSLYKICAVMPILFFVFRVHRSHLWSEPNLWVALAVAKVSTFEPLEGELWETTTVNTPDPFTRVTSLSHRFFDNDHSWRIQRDSIDVSFVICRLHR